MKTDVLHIRLCRAATVIAAVVALLAAGCGAGDVPVVRTETLMGTFVTISVTPGRVRGKDLDTAVTKAFDEVERINGLMSTYLDDSEISRINRLTAGETMDVSEDMAAILNRSIEINRITEGAFDVTVGPLVSLWGFGSGAETVDKKPSKTKIRQTLGRTGMDLVVLDPERRTVSLKKDNMYIDLSGIAKGYAVDRALDILKSAGVEHALVNAGGDVAGFGGKTNDNPWTIGVQRPVRDAGLGRPDIIGKIPMVAGAVATSGTYEQYITIGESTYSHIMDPRTGEPRQNVPSATVMAPDCTTADALATGLLVLGPNEAIAVVNKLDGVEALLLYHSANGLSARHSSGWTAKIDIN